MYFIQPFLPKTILKKIEIDIMIIKEWINLICCLLKAECNDL
jgi:hypothetical protein